LNERIHFDNTVAAEVCARGFASAQQQKERDILSIAPPHFDDDRAALGLKNAAR
jgi:DNA-binding IclR family transcriptional regulator